MSDRAVPPTSQLLVYRFGPDAEFQGRLVGALERIESAGAMRVLDALFVSSQAETGELSAVALRGVGAGGFVAPLHRSSSSAEPPSSPGSGDGGRPPGLRGGHDRASYGRLDHSQPNPPPITRSR